MNLFTTCVGVPAPHIHVAKQQILTLISDLSEPVAWTSFAVKLVGTWRWTPSPKAGRSWKAVYCTKRATKMIWKTIAQSAYSLTFISCSREPLQTALQGFSTKQQWKMKAVFRSTRADILALNQLLGQGYKLSLRLLFCDFERHGLA